MGNINSYFAKVLLSQLTQLSMVNTASAGGIILGADSITAANTVGIGAANIATAALPAGSTTAPVSEPSAWASKCLPVDSQRTYPWSP